jgi:hypothetical protein
VTETNSVTETRKIGISISSLQTVFARGFVTRLSVSNSSQSRDIARGQQEPEDQQTRRMAAVPVENAFGGPICLTN